MNSVAFLGWTQRMRRNDMTDQRYPLAYYLELTYPYTVEPDEGSFFISFPDLPNCMTQVDDAADIAAMAEEIRTLWIETEYERGATIPEPAIQSGFSGKFVVRVPKSLHRDLVIAARREGSSLNAYVSYLLAERNMAAHAMTRLRDLKSRADQAGTVAPNMDSTPVRPELATRR